MPRSIAPRLNRVQRLVWAKESQTDEVARRGLAANPSDGFIAGLMGVVMGIARRNEGSAIVAKLVPNSGPNSKSGNLKLRVNKLRGGVVNAHQQQE